MSLAFYLNKNTKLETDTTYPINYRLQGIQTYNYVLLKRKWSQSGGCFL